MCAGIHGFLHCAAVSFALLIARENDLGNRALPSRSLMVWPNCINIFWHYLCCDADQRPYFWKALAEFSAFAAFEVPRDDKHADMPTIIPNLRDTFSSLSWFLDNLITTSPKQVPRRASKHLAQVTPLPGGGTPWGPSDHVKHETVV